MFLYIVKNNQFYGIETEHDLFKKLLSFTWCLLKVIVDLLYNNKNVRKVVESESLYITFYKIYRLLFFILKQEDNLSFCHLQQIFKSKINPSRTSIEKDWEKKGYKSLEVYMCVPFVYMNTFWVNLYNMEMDVKSF